MQYRTFAHTKIPLSVIGFGSAAIAGEGGGYGFGPISDDEANTLLHYVFDRGINLYDTAPLYGFGLAEKRIGRAFNGSKREKIFLISKGGITWDINRRVDLSNQPSVIDKMFHQSLRDLQTEYIDLYMIHWPDPRIDIRYPMELLARLKEQKKIRYIGLCNTNQEELDKAQTVTPLSAIQNQFNLFHNEASQLFPYLSEHQMAFMGWGSLDKGILTGTVHEKRVFHSLDARSKAPWWKKERAMREKKMAVVKRLEEIGKSSTLPVSLLAMAIGHNLSYPSLTSTLCGGRNMKQWDDLINIVDNLPSADFLSEINNIIEKTSLGDS